MLTFDLRQDLEEGPDGGLDRPTHYRPPDRIGLRVAWILHREALMEPDEHVVADDHRRICRRPWAWWQFEAPEQPRAGERKIACLRRLGLLRLDEEGMHPPICSLDGYRSLTTVAHHLRCLLAFENRGGHRTWVTGSNRPSPSTSVT